MMILPTEIDLAALPVRAIVAYAVRCALRVRSLLVMNPGESGHEDVCESVDAAITLASRFAAGEDIDASKVSEVEHNVADAVKSISKSEGAKTASTLAANAAYAAINATNQAKSFIKSRKKMASPDKVAKAAIIAADSAIAADEMVGQSVSLDWVMLNRTYFDQEYDRNELLDPSEQGPLGSLFGHLLLERKHLQMQKKQLEEERQQIQPRMDELRREQENFEQERATFDHEIATVREEKEQLQAAATELAGVIQKWTSTKKTFSKKKLTPSR